MLMESDRVRAAKMSPSPDWLGLSVFRLGIDDLLALARDRVQAEGGEAVDQCGVTQVVCFQQSEQER